MKPIELRLISELMKDSRRSARELSKVLGVSQPTVSRVLKKLEQRGAIKEYTVIPDFTMLGYELMALTFVTIRPALDPAETDRARETAQKLMKEGPGNIIMLESGIGLNHTGAIISFHKDYSDYSRFIQEYRQASTTQAYVHENVESFLIDLKDKARYRPLALSVLADYTLKMNEQKK